MLIMCVERLISTIFVFIIITEGRIYTPVVIWHGVDDDCCSGYVGNFMSNLNKTMPGVYMHSLQIGASPLDDILNGFFLHPDKQIEIACGLISNDSKLSRGFNAISFSQGSQFMRALIQRCPAAKVRNFISMGGQHQGVYGVPKCPKKLPTKICNSFRELLNNFAYNKKIQNILVQATFWHDPLREQEYKTGSTFLSDINNEVHINSEYVKRLQSLGNFVMVKFLNDSVVQPIESSWFGFYKPGQAEEVLNLYETNLYLQNRLGLREMAQELKLHFISAPGAHVIFEWTWFEEYIVPFLIN